MVKFFCVTENIEVVRLQGLGCIVGATMNILSFFDKLRTDTTDSQTPNHPTYSFLMHPHPTYCLTSLVHFPGEISFSLFPCQSQLIY